MEHFLITEGSRDWPPKVIIMECRLIDMANTVPALAHCDFEPIPMGMPMGTTMHIPYGNTHLALLGQQNKNVQFVLFPEWCLPGGQNDPTPRGSILHPSRGPKRPYFKKETMLRHFRDVGPPLKQMFKSSPKQWPEAGWKHA